MQSRDLGARETSWVWIWVEGEFHRGQNEVLSRRTTLSDHSARKRGLVIHLNETTVMRLADGKDAELPPVRQNEALAGGRDSDEPIDSGTWRSVRHGRNRFGSKGGGDLKS
jgi:hypothetical protein